MAKRKIVTPYNGLYSMTTEPKSILPDMCVPDQTMSIREILDRYTRGLSISDGKVPVYNDEDPELTELANFDRMELTDRMELLQTKGKALQAKWDKFISDQESARKKAIIDEYEQSRTPAPSNISYPEAKGGLGETAGTVSPKS